MPVSIDLVVEALSKHRISLLSYAWVVVGDAQLADDVVQDISLLAIKKVDQIKEPSHILPWLRHSVRLRGLEVRRLRNRQAMLLDSDVLDVLGGVRTSLDRYSESDKMQSLRQCYEKLPAKSRGLLKLRYTDGCKPAEIAEQTQKTRDAVYKSLQSVHGLLKKCIKDRLLALGGDNG
ncbi:MAG: sigma-70 family RNA polymerase sigma factor [Planctomycetota bacterium]